jgi:hypothetical protein
MDSVHGVSVWILCALCTDSAEILCGLCMDYGWILYRFHVDSALILYYGFRVWASQTLYNQRCSQSSGEKLVFSI